MTDNTPSDIKMSKSFRLFTFLSKLNTQAIALVILVLLSLQVLIGLLLKTPTTVDLVAFYFGRTMIIRFLGYLGLVNWLIDFYCKSFIHKEKIWKWTFLKRPWTGLLAVLLFWSFCAIWPARDVDLAIFGSAFRYEGFLSYLAYAGIFLNAALIRGEEQRKVLFITVTATSTFLALVTLLKEMAHVRFLMFRNGQVGAYSATFINSNHYGYYLCVSMMVIAGLFMMSEKLWAKIACGVCFAVNMIVMLYNGSLGPYLAILFGMILFFIFFWIRKGFRKTWPLLILVAVFILLSLVIRGQAMIKDLGLIVRQTDKVIDVINSGGAGTSEGQQAIDSIGSSRGRLWKETIQVILKHPEIGVGTDNIQHFIHNEIPHNEYLQVAANLGFPGILFYLGALICCFAYTIKNLKKLSDGTLIAGMATLVYCASAFVGISIPVATFQLFFFLGLLTGWFRTRDENTINEQRIKELNRETQVS